MRAGNCHKPNRPLTIANYASVRHHPTVCWPRTPRLPSLFGTKFEQNPRRFDGDCRFGIRMRGGVPCDSIGNIRLQKLGLGRHRDSAKATARITVAAATPPLPGFTLGTCSISAHVTVFVSSMGCRRSASVRHRQDKSTSAGESLEIVFGRGKMAMPGAPSAQSRACMLLCI